MSCRDVTQVPCLNEYMIKNRKAWLVMVTCEPIQGYTEPTLVILDHQHNRS